jgi:uncharacterized membrane protein YhfC
LEFAPILQNIDPVYILQPIITILFSLGLVVYWYNKRSFTKAVAVYSLIAYAGAILIKVILQAVTASAFVAHFGGNPYALGAYFGIQTVVFEVGGAFLVATFAVSRGKLTAKDYEGYGLGLGLWENAVLVGGLSLLNLLVIYVTLAIGGPAAQHLYGALVDANSEFFAPPTQALGTLAYGLLERVSSLILHFAWGLLCLVSAVTRKRLYFIMALPMGLVDFLVPFSKILTIPVFETGIFILAVLALQLSLYVSRGVRQVP